MLHKVYIFIFMNMTREIWMLNMLDTSFVYICNGISMDMPPNGSHSNGINKNWIVTVFRFSITINCPTALFHRKNARLWALMMNRNHFQWTLSTQHVMEFSCLAFSKSKDNLHWISILSHAQSVAIENWVYCQRNLLETQVFVGIH